MSDIQTKLIDDNLTINIVDLLSSLTGEQEQQLIEQLSCSDTIIEHVANQIIDGLTENGFSGFCGAGAEPSTVLDKAIRKVAESSSDIASSEIAKLQSNVTRYHDLYKEWMDKYFDIYHGRTNHE